MTIVSHTIPPACVEAPEAYANEILQVSSRQSLTAAERARLATARAAVHRQCAACPLLVDCLYRAVVEVDVSGFAACTTEDERAWMREQLGVEVDQTSLTPYGAPRAGGGPVSHKAVLTARQAYPKDTCHQLADRLGCSTSTIKRHLRRDRQSRTDDTADAELPTQPALPTIEDVLNAFDALESAQIA